MFVGHSKMFISLKRTCFIISIQMLRSGKGVLEQIVNRLTEYKKYALPETSSNGHEDLSVVDRVNIITQNGGDLEIPAHVLKSVELKTHSSKANFHGFQVATRYVICLSDYS